MPASNTKGKGKAIGQFEPNDTQSIVGSSRQDSYDSDSSVTQEYLDALLEKAKVAITNRRETRRQEAIQIDEQEIVLDNEQKPLPGLDPRFSLPATYSISRKDSLIPNIPSNKPDVKNIERVSPADPAPPPPPPELNKDNKPLTKRQKKELRHSTIGPDWFDMHAPPVAEMPRLYHEVEALRLRNTLDPKRFYRREEGEGEGIKGLPKYFAVGTIIPESTPFGTPNSDNIPRSQRKRAIVDELVEDAEAKQYAKKRFLDLQVVRGAQGRGTLVRKKAARKPKW